MGPLQGLRGAKHNPLDLLPYLAAIPGGLVKEMAHRTVPPREQRGINHTAQQERSVFKSSTSVTIVLMFAVVSAGPSGPWCVSMQHVTNEQWCLRWTVK